MGKETIAINTKYNDPQEFTPGKILKTTLKNYTILYYVKHVLKRLPNQEIKELLYHRVSDKE